MKRKASVIVLLLVLCVLLGTVVAPAFASSGYAVVRGEAMQAPAPMDLTAFLQWLIGGGGSILAVSWFLERMAWFQALSSNAKDYTIFGSSAVVGCSALAVVTYAPAVALAAIAPYFLILSSTFVLVFVVKAFHKVDKKTDA